MPGADDAEGGALGAVGRVRDVDDEHHARRVGGRDGDEPFVLLREGAHRGERGVRGRGAARVGPAREGGQRALRLAARELDAVGDDALPRFAELEARMEREFAQITAASTARDTPDASHG